jgi:hypothetical protein
MRIRNLSTVAIPKALWHELASIMKVGNNLPGAMADEFGIYGACHSLSVTVRPSRYVPEGKVTTTGTYT